VLKEEKQKTINACANSSFKKILYFFTIISVKNYYQLNE